MAVAHSDVGTRLYSGSGSSYTELIPVKTATTPRGEAQSIDVTELWSPDSMEIKGRRASKQATFQFNHTEANMTKVIEVCDGESHDFVLRFGDGTGYKFSGMADFNHEDVAANQAINGVLTVFVTSQEYLSTADLSALIPTD